MSKERLIRFDMDLGDAYGISYEIVNDEEAKLLFDYKGNQIYLGEISGKHSDVVRELTSECFEVVTTNPEKIAIFKELTGGHIGSFSVIDTISEQLENDQ